MNWNVTKLESPMLYLVQGSWLILAAVARALLLEGRPRARLSLPPTVILQRFLNFLRFLLLTCLEAYEVTLWQSLLYQNQSCFNCDKSTYSNILHYFFILFLSLSERKFSFTLCAVNNDSFFVCKSYES